MIITRTPFRISFFGGGTDFPTWYEQNGGGAVLSTTINKYCYISCRNLPPFFDYRYRLNYSKQEQAGGINEIMHPSIRETLRFMDMESGLSISHDGDLPAMSGLGSSSAFTVGLLHALYALNGKIVSKKRLALEAIHIEQNMIKETVGSQDQVAAAFGGLNRIEFGSQHNIQVIPVTMNRDAFMDFQDHFLLFFTGVTRSAAKIEEDKIGQVAKKKSDYKELLGMVNDAISILGEGRELSDFGKLLHDTWKLKKSLSPKVSNPYIDTIYETAKKNGALGGKILGAGGGGFMLFFARPEKKDKIKKALHFLLHVPFRFDGLGSQIVYYTEEVS
jgi:D-glycero-alpha-D-manno-heptose-7-phosphate kinase